MGLIISGGYVGPAVPTGPYTKLLLHFNNNFNDASGNNHLVTPTSFTSDGLPWFGLNSTSSIVTSADMVVGNHYDFEFGRDDFTIDFWWKLLWPLHGKVILFSSSTGQSHFWDIPYGFPYGWNDYLMYFYYSHYYGSYGGGKKVLAFRIYYQNTEIAACEYDLSQFNTGIWHHTALVRRNRDILIFVDGQLPLLADTVTRLNGFVLPGGGVNILMSNSYVVEGHYLLFDEYRISKGIARWVTNFTPPTNEYSPD